MVQLTPPLGWNTWNTFGNEINEALIRESADKMVESGLAAAGYRYIVIDDCWSLKERDKNGRLVADPEKFPSGMKALADYVHSKGLKFGIYSCAGLMTCAGYPSSYDYEYIDAQTFAEWGVDYLKYDYCNRSPLVEGKYLYRRMGTALANCGRDIVFSACSWGADNTHEWIKTTGAHLWRSTGDINDSFQSVHDLTEQQNKLHPFNGVGCFNDMDMLIVGMNGSGNVANGGCTMTEYRTHFSIWCMLGSPLMIGCDIRSISDEAKAILTNPGALGINQDPACNQPYRISQICGGWQCVIYARLLANGDFAIGVFNFSSDDQVVYFGLDEIGMPVHCGKTLELNEVWTGRRIAPHDGVVSDFVKSHDCSLFRCRVV